MIRFWKKLTHQLVQWGFVITPYDPCMVNKVVNGSQFTITWHIDNLKISHVDPSMLDTFMDDLNQVFGKQSLGMVHKGPRHDCLGITLDYSSPGKVIGDMKQYIDKILSETPPDIKGVAQTTTCVLVVVVATKTWIIVIIFIIIVTMLVHYCYYYYYYNHGREI